MNVTSSAGKCLLLLVASVAFTTGCYPGPHQYIESQAISGVLIKSGSPAAGINVSLAHTRGDDGNYCKGSRVVGVTDKDGRFHVDPSVHVDLFTSLLNPPNQVSQLTSVCFEVPGEQVLGVLLMASTDRMKSFELSCDLNSGPREFKQGVVWPSDKWGICSNPG
jgi:hypothetical protein